MAEKTMNLLDICDEVLLDILALVDPVDLVNIYNVCERLRPLAEWSINKVVLKLDLTGINCFPNLKHQPFDNMDRIRVNRNWVDGKFSRETFFRNTKSIRIRFGIAVDEHFYVADKGAIRKYNRLKDRTRLSCRFKLIGKREEPNILRFVKKDNVIFAYSDCGNCMIFENEKPAIMRSPVYPSACLDLCPKNNIYVAGTIMGVQIFNKRPEYGTLLEVDEIPHLSFCLKIDPSGENVITGTRDYDYETLYNFNTKTNEKLVELDGVSEFFWKDNQTILSGHDDGFLKVFDLRTKSICQRIAPLWEDHIVSIQFDGQNTVLCGLSDTKTVNICDLRMNKVIKELDFFDEKDPNDYLSQIVADQKHLFVATERRVDICDFSII